MKDKTNKIYIKGYKDGFESALKMAWAYAEELLVNVDNSAKDKVREYIKKLTH